MKRSQTYLKAAHYYASISPDTCCNSGCIVLGDEMPRGFWGTPEEEIEKAFPEYALFKPTKEEQPNGRVWWNSSDADFATVRMVAMIIAHEIAKSEGN